MDNQLDGWISVCEVCKVGKVSLCDVNEILHMLSCCSLAPGIVRAWD